jgi:hypothetical protein
MKGWEACEIPILAVRLILGWKQRLGVIRAVNVCYGVLRAEDITAKAIGIVAVVPCFLTLCQAGQETIEYAKIRNVKTLSGVVIDPAGAPIVQVRVLEMSDDWKTEPRSTMTDAQGRWSLPPNPGSKAYRIRFVEDGFDQVWLPVRLTK